MGDFETWFRAEVIADRLFPADENAARHTWDAVMAMNGQDTARLDFLIENEARVGEGVNGFHHVWGGPLGDPENLAPRDAHCKTARDAIDAARVAGKR